MIQVNRTSVVVDPHSLAALRTDFRDRQFAVLPNLLDAELLRVIAKRLDLGPWRKLIHETGSVEIVLTDPIAQGLLHMAANAHAFLNAVRAITSCDDVTCFIGRVYRFLPNSGHYDTWHSDASTGRRLGMSVNLSSRAYAGGIFQLRKRDSETVLLEHANLGFGDATLFRIAADLQHRVTDVQGSESKTAFAGWFCAGQPNYLDGVRQSPTVR